MIRDRACRHREKFQPYPSNPALVKTKPPGNLIGDVELASLDIGAAVVDSNYLATVVPGIYHPHDGPERKRLVGSRSGIHVVNLPIRGRLPIEAPSVPARGAFPYRQGSPLVGRAQVKLGVYMLQRRWLCRVAYLSVGRGIDRRV